MRKLIIIETMQVYKDGYTAVLKQSKLIEQEVTIR